MCRVTPARVMQSLRWALAVALHNRCSMWLQDTRPACREALTCESHVGLVLPQGHAHCPRHLALAPAVQLRSVRDQTLLDLGVAMQLALQQERVQG